MEIFKQNINIEEYYKMMYITETVHKQTNKEVYEQINNKNNTKKNYKANNNQFIKKV